VFLPHITDGITYFNHIVRLSRYSFAAFNALVKTSHSPTINLLGLRHIPGGGFENVSIDLVIFLSSVYEYVSEQSEMSYFGIR